MELFDRPEQFSWTKKSENYGAAMFVTGDATYKVLIGGYAFGQTLVWSVQFEALPMDADKWTISNTGTGNEHTVFSTVIAAIKEFMEFAGYRTIHMQTSDRSRAALYPKMLKKLLPQWTVVVDGSQIFAVKPGDPTPSDDDDEA